MFSGEDRFEDAHARIERVKSHTVNDTHNWLTCRGYRPGFGINIMDLERRNPSISCSRRGDGELFEQIGGDTRGNGIRDILDEDGEPLETALPVACVNSSCSDEVTGFKR